VAYAVYHYRRQPWQLMSLDSKKTRKYAKTNKMNGSVDFYDTRIEYKHKHVTLFYSSEANTP